jgi:uncharacterized membrane protein
MNAALRVAAAALLAIALSACAGIPPVQAWEKAALARPEMVFGSAPLGVRNEDHVYVSREAAAGGRSVGGGGCGCN